MRVRVRVGVYVYERVWRLGFVWKCVVNNEYLISLG